MPDDVTHLLPGEGPVEEAPQPEVVAQPEPVETVTWKVRGEERQIPVDRLDSLAESMGTSRETALMYLQTGKDAGSHYQELKLRERELAQREAELDQRANQYQPTPQRQPYGQPTHQQYQPQQQSNGLPDDPLDLLRWQAQQIQALQERMEHGFRATEEQQKMFAETVQQERNRIESTQIESAFKHLVDTKKQAGMPVPDYETIEREMLESGMAQNRSLPWDKAFERAYRNVYFDDASRMAERKATDRLRDPKATITVAGGSGGAAKPAAPPTAEQSLGSMTWGQAIEGIPESRR
jgi:hypothetical protein